MSYIKNFNDMFKHLNTQIQFLKSSIHSYDTGFEDEAQRIATVIRILLHDTDSSESLFKHLDLKEQILFLSTALPYVPTNQISYEGLMATSSTGFYLPHCLSDSSIHGICLSFEDWWNEIILDDKKYVLSRKNIILDVANKDGGAHVDKKLNEAYANLTKNHSLSGRMLVNNEKIPLYNSPAYACIRQIAFELLYSIEYDLNIKTFTRKTDITENFFVAYIDKELYFRTEKTLNSPLFEDSRITKTEKRKHYIDTVCFVSGKESNRHVVLK